MCFNLKSTRTYNPEIPIYAYIVLVDIYLSNIYFRKHTTILHIEFHLKVME